MYRTLRYLLRKFYLTLAIVVIVFAVLVQSGRAFSYLAAEYKDEFALYLSEKIDGQVKLGSLKAEWDDLQPVLEVSALSVFDRDNIEFITIENIWLRLDLLATLLERELVWGNFTLSGSSVTLEQGDQGSWKLRGSHIFQAEGLSTSNDGKADGVLDTLLVAKKVSIENTAIQLLFRDEQAIVINSPSLLLENKGDFHRLLLNVDTDAHNNALFFVAEGVGDPREKSFESEAYLQFHGFPISKFSTALTAFFSGTTDSQFELDDGVVDGCVWFVNESFAGGYGMVGSLAMSGVYLREQKTNGNQSELQQLKLTVDTELSGQVNNFNQWHMNFQNFQSSIGGVNLDPTNISISRALPNAPLDMKISKLEVHQITSLLLSNNMFPKKSAVAKVVHELNGSGELRNIQLVLPLKNAQNWKLASNLKKVSVESWNQVPAFNNVSGYLSASQYKGFIDLDSQADFSMSFHGVYDEPLMFSSAKGQVAWYLLPDENKIYVNSGRLLLGDNNELAQGEFLLSLPWRKSTDDVDLTISLKAEEVQLVQQRKYVPNVVHENIRTWLDKSIGEKNSGVATAVDFVFRGTVSTRELIDKSVQLSLALRDGELQYHPDWPEISKVNADVLLDNADFYSVIYSGVLYNSQISQAVLSITDNTEDDGSLLRVVGSVDGIASDGLRILRESMLQKYVGNAMDSWFLHGQMEGNVDIAVPLQKDKKGGYQNIEFMVDAPSFSLDNLNLEFTDLEGTLSYHSDLGLISDGLNADLFGHPVVVTIGSELAAANQTLVNVKGVVASHDLAVWTKRPEVLFLDGDIAYEAHIEINHQSAKPHMYNDIEFGPNTNEAHDDLLAAISVESSLQGVQVNLPEPFFKGKDLTRNLSLSYILGTDSTLIDIQYENLLTTVLHMNNESSRLLSGSVGIGKKAKLPVEPSFHVDGSIASFDAPEWKAILTSYKKKENILFDDKTNMGENLTLPITADILISEQKLGPVELTNLRVRARRLPDSWDVLLSNELLVGEVNLPFDQSLPVKVAMESLTIDEELLASDEANPVVGDDAKLDLSAIRDTKFSVQTFSVGAKDYGSWAFDLKTRGKELLVSNIEGLVRDLSVSGDQGADLSWNSDTNLTSLTARIYTDDLSTALEKWNHPPRINSESAQFDIDLTWPGVPQTFSLLTTTGRIDVLIKKGKFIRRSGSTGEGLLRLMGLFNFDTLARRLRLDFSDLSGGGLAFDQITGELLFDRGLLHISQPIVLDGASSKMQLTGDIDITNETLDTQLVATLPLAGNLTVVAALAAGLPAAAGVWIVSKLFEKQVSKMTSVSYSITGSWNEPVSQFDRLAEDKSGGPGEIENKGPEIQALQ